MKMFIAFVLFSLFNSVHSHAQNKDEIQITLRYIARFKYRKEKKQIYEDEKVLEIGKNYSVFYGLWNTRRDEIKDSVSARGGSFSEIMQALAKCGYPLSKQNYAVYKNYPLKGELTYTDKVFKKFKYTEKMEQPAWEILEGDSLIYDYPCQKAQTIFRGRTWTVWFAPSIPASDGPWKLYGLPGLILEADDAAGEFSFHMISIQKGNGGVMKRPSGKYLSCTPEKLAEMHARSAKDPESYLQYFGVPPSKGFGPDGKPLKYEGMHPVFLERHAE